jgi:hypothetical protein
LGDRLLIEFARDLQFSGNLKSPYRRTRHAAAGAVDFTFVISKLGEARLGGSNEFIRLQWSGQNAAEAEGQDEKSHG